MRKVGVAVKAELLGAVIETLKSLARAQKGNSTSGPDVVHENDGTANHIKGISLYLYDPFHGYI